MNVAFVALQQRAQPPQCLREPQQIANGPTGVGLEVTHGENFIGELVKSLNRLDSC